VRGGRKPRGVRFGRKLKLTAHQIQKAIARRELIKARTDEHEFVVTCKADDVSPDDVLNGFVADLCDLDGSHGSESTTVDL
jgi:hypothetical protein